MLRILHHKRWPWILRCSNGLSPSGKTTQYNTD
ncbi:Uncharacterised protein [Vibrio cholerae]|nr:Uncharacterised protein [Vibrio cholerae]